jgi:organic radical activating enzyme
MKLTYKDPKKKDWFLVSWTLSNKCNYRCSYCPDILHNGSTGHADWETVSNFVKNFSKSGKTICYRLSGGEPTYWKHFVDLAKLVKSQGHVFSFLTNGSQSVDYYKEIGRYTDGMIISYHEEYADVDHLIEISKNIGCPVFINLMLVPDKFNKLYTVAKRLFEEGNNINVWPKVIVDKSNIILSNQVVDYTEEQKSLIKDWPFFKKVNDELLHRGELLLNDVTVTANDLIIKNLNNYKGWKCWAGIDMINIDMWGDIYRADCQQGGPIGNLKQYDMPTMPIICDANKCACLSDIYLRKEQ